jgi:16S rRNA (guanine966-N2)-methyltransferase
MFAILGGRVIGSRTLDLFAGSGALGLEAVSRGAESCVFVEKHHKAIKVIRENIASLGLEKASRVISGALSQVGNKLHYYGPYELILADPPYEKGFIADLMAIGHGLLSPDGVMVLEHSPKETPDLHGSLVLSDQRAYGQTMLSFLRNGHDKQEGI